MSKRGAHKRAKEAVWRKHMEETEACALSHPVLSGRVKVEQYREPNWRYVRPEPIRNGLEIGI